MSALLEQNLVIPPIGIASWSSQAKSKINMSIDLEYYNLCCADKINGYRDMKEGKV